MMMTLPVIPPMITAQSLQWQASGHTRGQVAQFIVLSQEYWNDPKFTLLDDLTVHAEKRLSFAVVWSPR